MKKKKRERTRTNTTKNANSSDTKKEKEGDNDNDNDNDTNHDNGLDFPQPKKSTTTSRGLGRGRGRGRGRGQGLQCSCSQFLESFLPSKHQIRDAQLQNRMKICILAVCLMWATSLRVAVYISKHAINVPSIYLLYESCKSAFQIAVEEKERYSKCISVQLDQCNSDLHQSAVAEVRRVNVSSMKNTDILHSVRDSYEMCASDYTSLRYSLEGWVNNGQSLPLLESSTSLSSTSSTTESTGNSTSTNTNTNTCSAAEQQELMTSIGDMNLIRSEAKALSEEYGLNSQNTVQNIASYARARSEYDREYLDNHTQAMQDVVQSYMNEVSQNMPDLDVDGIIQELYDNLDNAVSCITPRNPNKGQCANITGVYDLIDDAYMNWVDLTTAWMDHADEIGRRFKQYKDNVDAAYEISSSFYYSECIRIHVMFFILLFSNFTFDTIQFTIFLINVTVQTLSFSFHYRCKECNT